MKWEEIPFSTMIIGEKYKIEHSLKFNDITAWCREYTGIFCKYNIRGDKAFFKITSSYDFVEKIEPHVGPKWFPDTILVFRIVRQGQVSMERRAYKTILSNLIEGILPPIYF